jgi:hypothetical protein
MGVKEWIGDTHDPNNVHPRILILLIIIVLTFGFLIMISQNYSEAAMLGGILLISLDKIFGKSWLVNRTAYFGSKSKRQTMRKWWKMIFHYGIVDDYLGLIGTGIIIAVIISEIYRALILGDTTILAILWNRITKAIPINRLCILFIVAKYRYCSISKLYISTSSPKTY